MNSAMFCHPRAIATLPFARWQNSWESSAIYTTRSPARLVAELLTDQAPWTTSVAMSSNRENQRVRDLGVRLIQGIAAKTNEIAGDGTTTATVLARAIYSEGVKNLAAGCNPMDLRRGSQAAVDRDVQTVTTTAEITQVAMIWANGDTYPIAQAMEKVGKVGVITVKERPTIEDEMRLGLRRRFISLYFVADVKVQTVEFEKPLILLSEKKISLLQDILHNRKSVFTDELEVKLEKVMVDLLGSTGSVTVTKDDTIILNGEAREGGKDAIQARCEQIRSLIADPTTSDYDRSKLQVRLAKLSGGVAVIKVGGASEVEVGEKKDRYDDALNATRAAVEEAILPGGGVALLKASLQLKTTSPASSAGHATPIPTANFDQELGVAIIRRAITNPARTIFKNAGEESSVIVGRILGEYGVEGKFNWGYDAGRGEYVDMVAAGIVDPLKVVRTALVDAAGVASLLTTSEACVFEAVEEGAAKGPMGGMGGGMGGMGMGGF
ncbi:hypothetical protein DFP72DRAFT_1037298 [Ephemerocybe angulata]|uniref:Uncharacterized protein n=1 Tax=Ephemerocybe angulata TaxID=980116 RepID=A0A8H6H8I4_9AGAR|nr:hypothetical protein DFP72DRAFT_1037298 [Tulosesus angulatus]